MLGNSSQLLGNTSDPSETSTLENTSLPLSNATDSLGTAKEEHIYETIARALDIYILTFITIGGAISNLLALLVLNKRGVANSSVCVYLSTLACSDTLVLLLNWINNWFISALDINVIGYSNVVCRLFRYTFSTSYIYSAWVVVALAVERFLAITFPLAMTRISSPRKAIAAVLLILSVGLGVMSYQIFTYEARDGFCNWHVDFLDFHMNVNGWFLGTLYSYVPFFTLLTCSIGIIVGLAKAARRRSAMTTDTGSNNDVQRVSLTVVVVCLTYLVLTTPLALFYLILYNLGMWVEPSPSMTLGKSIIINLGNMNHSVNLFLYVLTSASFREDLRSLCRCCCSSSFSSSAAKDDSSSKYLDQSASVTRLSTVSTNM